MCAVVLDGHGGESRMRLDQAVPRHLVLGDKLLSIEASCRGGSSCGTEPRNFNYMEPGSACAPPSGLVMIEESGLGEPAEASARESPTCFTGMGEK